MAGILTILFGSKQKDIGGVDIDGFVQEEHTLSCDVTKNPVEDGADVTDHVQLESAKLTIDGIVTDSPIRLGVISNFVNAGRAITNLFSTTKRSIDAYNQLESLWKSREPFTVVTSLKRYENMVFEELSVPRNSLNSNSISFSASLMQIRIAKNDAFGGLLNVNGTVTNLAAPFRDRGSKLTALIPTSSPLASNSQVITDPINKGAAELFSKV